MYKWPKELQPSELCGLVVEAITFTLNTITIIFGKDYFLTVESSVSLKALEVEEEILIPPVNTNLTCLLGKTVQASSLDFDGASLLLKFDDGCQLRLEGSDNEYECFHINAKGKEFTI